MITHDGKPVLPMDTSADERELQDYIRAKFAELDAELVRRRDKAVDQSSGA